MAIGVAAAGLVAGGIVVWRRGYLRLLDLRLFVEWRLHKILRLTASWSPPLLLSLVLVGIVVVLLLWKLPAWQVGRSKSLTDDNRFDRENEARKTLAQILGGVFVLASLYSSVQTFNLSREGQITDRFTKAIEQLGAIDGTGKPKLDVRLGGIYALERIARDSERDHWVIMEVLTAYVREHSPLRRDDQKAQKTPHAPQKAPMTAREEIPHVGADIQAILTVLGRREIKYDKGMLDLTHTDLGGADLGGATLNGASLREALFLTQEQIDSAYGDGQTELPPDLKKPESWTK